MRGAAGGPARVLPARDVVVVSQLTALAYWRLRVRHAGPTAHAWQATVNGLTRHDLNGYGVDFIAKAN